jgi:glutaredoxin
MLYEEEVNNRTPILFALSTCPRCQRLREFLEQQGIAVRVVEVDLLPFEEKKAHIDFVRHVNPRISFPTLVIGDLAVIGEDYDAAREALAL